MFANGDDMRAIREAYPALVEDQVEAAALYAQAYPYRRCPRGSVWRNRKPVASGDRAFDDLPPSRCLATGRGTIHVPYVLTQP